MIEWAPSELESGGELAREPSGAQESKNLWIRLERLSAEVCVEIKSGFAISHHYQIVRKINR